MSCSRSHIDSGSAGRQVGDEGIRREEAANERVIETRLRKVDAAMRVLARVAGELAIGEIRIPLAAPLTKGFVSRLADGVMPLYRFRRFTKIEGKRIILNRNANITVINRCKGKM